MTNTLEIYNNGIRVIIENDVVPIQFIFKNERNEITGHSILSVDRLQQIMAASENEFAWYRFKLPESISSPQKGISH